MAFTARTKKKADLTSLMPHEQKPRKYKSKFEKTVGDFLGTRASYEPDKLKFIQPSKQRLYIPDFKIGESTYIESKGKWTSEDRQKHVWIKEQHPEKRIILLFQNSKVRLSKVSKTTYGDWATKHGLEWYDWKQGLPEELIRIINDNQSSGRNPRRGRRNSSKSK
jgi:predicted nuclease of restriction endonuclease-like RecB superfamily